MCGIVGYIGNDDVKEVLLGGLEKLEYRGYDSAGIAMLNKDGVQVFKEAGRIADLRAAVDHEMKSSMGIGHTRWATHGAPTRENAHPHQSISERFTLVHNGVIENYVQLKKKFLKDVTPKSETDTEVIVQLIEQKVTTGLNVEDAFIAVLKLLKGSYALAMLDAENQSTLYFAKNRSPLLVGLGDTFNVVVSDAMAAIQLTNKYVELADKEIVIMTKDSVTIKTLAGEVVKRNPYTAEIDMNDIEKGTYPHYMLKEIDEQPSVIRRIVQKYKDDFGDLSIDSTIVDEVRKAGCIYIIACGTSYHAGLIGKQLLEKWANIPVEVHVASEFSYNIPLLAPNPLFVIISQSGETADSRSVLVQVKNLGHKVLTITNVQGSTLSREANYTLLLHAGVEISVASTKAYVAQLAVLAILASVTAIKKGIKLEFNLMRELGIVARALDSLCEDKEVFKQIATDFLETSRNCFFIGRNLDYYVSLEGALKLKEISYIQAEGFAGGELKHGTIALIEQGTPVIALATQEKVALNIRSNVKEVEARGANCCILSMSGLEMENDRYVLPVVQAELTPLVSVVPMQLIAYYAALHRGCDVDKPRNLAKSVTVE